MKRISADRGMEYIDYSQYESMQCDSNILCEDFIGYKEERADTYICDIY